MKRKLLIVTMLTVALFAVRLIADEQAGGEMQIGTPQQIKQFEHYIGSWKYVGEVKWDPSQTEWQPHEADIVYSYVCGGAALQMTWNGPMLGMDMHGLSLTCYDKVAGQFTEVWTDNLMGRMSHFAGNLDDGKLVMIGEELDPAGNRSWSRSTSYPMEGDSHRWTMEISSDKENWVTIMKGTFTRN